MSHSETAHAARFANGGSHDAFNAINTGPADEVARLTQRWPDEFCDGARCAFLRRFDGDRQGGGYPAGIPQLVSRTSERMVRRIQSRASFRRRRLNDSASLPQRGR